MLTKERMQQTILFCAAKPARFNRLSFRLIRTSDRLRNGTRQGAFESAGVYWFAQALHHESHRWLCLLTVDPLGAAQEGLRSYRALQQAILQFKRAS